MAGQPSSEPGKTGPATASPAAANTVPPAGSASLSAGQAPPANTPRSSSKLFTLRREVPRWQALLFGLLCIAMCGGVWHFLTVGDPPESRVLSPGVLPSIQETLDSFHSLWFDRALTRNLLASLERVALGFGLAALIGVPLGVLCGCFPWLNAFLAPVTIFGRNIPVAALIPLTFSLFGISELQKVMFIFIACVAFVVIDTARAVNDIDSRYIDTAYTLGASRRQIVLKVLVPLSLPNIFNSLRLLFGLAFGYIMLVELITVGDKSGGLGAIINISQRLGQQTYILLVLMIIPLVALAIDRFWFWIQRELFPHEYGGSGVLLKFVQLLLHLWEDFKSLFFSPVDYVQLSVHKKTADLPTSDPKGTP